MTALRVLSVRNSEGTRAQQPHLSRGAPPKLDLEPRPSTALGAGGGRASAPPSHGLTRPAQLLRPCEGTSSCRTCDTRPNHGGCIRLPPGRTRVLPLSAQGPTSQISRGPASDRESQVHTHTYSNPKIPPETPGQRTCEH